MIDQPSTSLQQAPCVVGDPPPPSASPERDAPLAAKVRTIGPRVKGTLHVVTMILRTTGVPMSVREIVEHGGADLPTRSKTPMTVVARDLAMDIKNKGAASAYIRTSPGRFTLRELVADQPPSSGNVVDMVQAARAVLGRPEHGQPGTLIPRTERVVDSVQVG